MLKYFSLNCMLDFNSKIKYFSTIHFLKSFLFFLKSIDFQGFSRLEGMHCRDLGLSIWAKLYSYWYMGWGALSIRERKRVKRVKRERGAWLAAMRMSLGLAVKCRPSSIFLVWPTERREQQRTPYVCSKANIQHREEEISSNSLF